MDFHIELASAQRILRPRVRQLAGALRVVMLEWNNAPNGFHMHLDNYGRAVNINQLWYGYARQVLAGDPAVSFAKFSNGYSMNVDDQLVLRIKQVDGSYRPRNSATRRALHWGQQLRFPTIPDLVRLDLGYRLDLTGSVVEDAVIMLTHNGHALWRWQIWGRPISKFASAPVDMSGNLVYVHNDYSKVAP